jgi:hypothetical protein
LQVTLLEALWDEKSTYEKSDMIVDPRIHAGHSVMEDIAVKLSECLST